MLTMIEEEQHLLSSLLDAREELYQQGTQFIFEALEIVLDGIQTYLNAEPGSIQWAGVEKVSDYIIIAGVVQVSGSAGRAIRVGMPIHLAEKGTKKDILEFLKKAGDRQKLMKATQTSPDGENMFDISKLTKDQIERLTLSMVAVNKIDPNTHH